MKAHKKFRCYIYGSDRDWEAICTDLDIAVQGRSIEDVKTLLDDAISGFIEELEKLPERDRKRLLSRKSPLYLRIQLRIFVFLDNFRRNSEFKLEKKRSSYEVSFMRP